MQIRLKEEDIIQIIDQVKQGQKQAFNALILAFEKDVFSLCMRMLRHREEAEEVAQDSFVRAFQRLKSFKAQSKFSTWLYRITYNNCLNRLKANKKQLLHTEWQEIHQEYSHAELSMKELKSEERKGFIGLAMNKLTENESALLNLYYQNECSLAEMQEILNTPKDTLKVQLHRARKRFEFAMHGILKDEIKSIV
jgi:RNA polymerase sigma factor (sigma-70 family)